MMETMMILKHQYSNNKSLSLLGLFFIACSTLFAQNYKKMQPFIWPINTSEVIIFAPSIDKNEFNKSNKKLSIIQMINPLGYYKLVFQNSSKSFRIFSYMMKEMKKNTLIKDVYPIFKLDKYSSDINLKRVGFSKLSLEKSRQLYKKIITLIPVLPRLFESSFRSLQKKTLELDISFDIQKGTAKNILLSMKDLTEFQEKEVKSLLQNQKWVSNDSIISVTFRPIIFKEVY
jgi:hypothetical protein